MQFASPVVRPTWSYDYLFQNFKHIVLQYYAFPLCPPNIPTSNSSLYSTGVARRIMDKRSDVPNSPHITHPATLTTAAEGGERTLKNILILLNIINI